MPESATSSPPTMNLPETPDAPPPEADSDPVVPREVPLPVVRTTLSAEAVLEKLAFASRRGRLAGYQPRQLGGREGGLFSVAAFGQPFDRVLIADATSDVQGVVLNFRTVLPLKWPGIFLAVLAFTVWPGVWLTDSLLTTYFASYPWWGVQTWMWYLPITVLPLPWMIRSIWRRSEAVSHDSAHRAIRKIAQELNGRAG